MSASICRAAGALLLVVATGCAESPVLEVGSIGFLEGDLRGLSQDQESTLILIATLASAVERGELEQLGEPFRTTAREARLSERLRAEIALERAGIEDAVLEARYAASPQWELEVRHLVRLSDRREAPEDRAEARAMAEEALRRIREGESFAAVAGELSEEPGAAARGGLLNPGREGTWVREFWNAALSLEVGEVSGIVETEYGFHVLQLDARRVVPFAEARPALALDVASMVDDGSAWRAWVESRLPDSLDEGARRSALAALARERGIELTPAEEAGIVREWERTVQPLLAAFDITDGLNPDELRDRALQALGATRQNVRVARADLRELAPYLEGAYPARDHR